MPEVHRTLELCCEHTENYLGTSEAKETPTLSSYERSLFVSYPDVIIALADLRRALDNEQRCQLAKQVLAAFLPQESAQQPLCYDHLRSFVNCLFDWHKRLPALDATRRRLRNQLQSISNN
jgi:hypothetical protein